LKIAREVNLTLSAKKVFEPEPKNRKQKPQTHWAAIAAANEKIAENENCLKIAHIYNHARTFFQKNFDFLYARACPTSGGLPHQPAAGFKNRKIFQLLLRKTGARDFEKKKGKFCGF